MWRTATMSNNVLKPLYYNIGEGITAFSTTRHGGVSKGNYASMNINPYCGDDMEAVHENLQRLAAELQLPAENILLPHQTHGVETRVIAEEFLHLPQQVKTMLLDGVDAVMTNIKGVCIGVSTADCIPVLLYDTEHNAIAAVHAGWRGTLSRIVLKTITDMRMTYGTKPAALRAVVGPGISIDRFEVGDEVYDAFQQASFDMEAIAREEIKRNPDAEDPAKQFEKKWHIDLPLCNKQMLVQAGVTEENITMSGICTYDNADNFFSARRLGVESGRIFTGICISCK